MPKNMISPIYRGLLIAFIYLWSDSLYAELGGSLGLYPTELDLIVKYDGTKRRNGSDSRETEWEAGLRIGQMGYLLDPKIVWFLIDIEPVYTWTEFDSSESRQENDGEFLNYLFQTNLLQGTPGPFGLDLSAQKSSNLNTGSLGSRFDTVIDTYNTTVHWKNPAFPTSISYEERALDEEFRTSLNSSVIERDEILKSWVLKGRSSKLSMYLERSDLDDRITTRNQDYELDKGNLSHNLFWGSNSHLHSVVTYYDRTGFNANERISIDETARIQHLDNLYSRTSYHYQSITQTIDNTEHGGDFELHHRLHKNLDTIAHVNINTRESDDLDEDRWRFGLETQYSKNKLFGANIRGGLRASYQETDRISNLSTIDIIDESQTVPLTGAILLDQRFIILNTIIVTDSNGVVVYDENTDYTILQLSGDLTQLQTVPGGRINSGDNILVTYQAQQLPSQEFSTTFTNYHFSIDFDWIRFTHSDSKSDDKLISGASESFLQNTRNTFTDIEFHFKPLGVDTVLGAERRFTLSGGFESTTHTYSQRFNWTSSWSKRKRAIAWNINATQSFIEQDTLDTDLYRIDLTANWHASRNLTIRPTISGWKRKDRGSAITGGFRDDRFTTAGIWAQWRYRKLELDFNYHHDRREVTSIQNNETTQTTDKRLMFTLRRRIL
ncbi:hypothetical protein [Candidatus Thiodiazotropha sp. CDECU1]|uniref:hypothetical protein n=1 Tax=Candidatus Thiodiazotropha sp. CDECU1 TaxID=3065865 RepID=UPI0029309DD5|nr:hypothetical protein [Candidatus Thiodiazotropha sp. CDECU1]